MPVPLSSRSKTRANDVSSRIPSGYRVVGVGELVISDDPNATLVTYSLGSCIGLALYDPALRLGGMLHCQLPLARHAPEQATQRPARFADRGAEFLLTALYQRGARRERLRLWVAGGARILDEPGRFRIGQRNTEVIDLFLRKNNLAPESYAVGGVMSRTIYLRLADGQFRLRQSKTMQEST